MRATNMEWVFFILRKEMFEECFAPSDFNFFFFVIVHPNDNEFRNRKTSHANIPESFQENEQNVCLKSFLNKNELRHEWMNGSFNSFFSLALITDCWYDELLSDTCSDKSRKQQVHSVDRRDNANEATSSDCWGWQRDVQWQNKKVVVEVELIYQTP